MLSNKLLDQYSDTNFVGINLLQWEQTTPNAEAKFLAVQKQLVDREGLEFLAVAYDIVRLSISPHDSLCSLQIC